MGSTDRLPRCVTYLTPDPQLNPAFSDFIFFMFFMSQDAQTGLQAA